MRRVVCVEAPVVRVRIVPRWTRSTRSVKQLLPQKAALRPQGRSTANVRSPVATRCAAAMGGAPGFPKAPRPPRVFGFRQFLGLFGRRSVLSAAVAAASPPSNPTTTLHF
eukprot:1186094-Prorocentrum_minimum.AAC.1